MVFITISVLVTHHVYSFSIYQSLYLIKTTQNLVKIGYFCIHKISMVVVTGEEYFCNSP